MHNITRLLSASEQGDAQAMQDLPPLLYDKLHRLAAELMAREHPGQILQATALVNEAYLRLVEPTQTQHWNGRGHFFQRPKTRLGLPIFTLATDRTPEPCVVIVVMRSPRF